MTDVLDTAVATAAAKHPRRLQKTIQYGTAGFRTQACELNHVLYRMGLLAVLRSKVKKATIGVMITASHNPEADNGVKLVDPHGEMLEHSWERHATMLANARDEDLKTTLSDLITTVGVDMSCEASIFIGRDTRASSPVLAQAAVEGVRALGGSVQDYGVVTTPMLHYFVVCKNTNGTYGEASEGGYYNKLANAFTHLQNKGQAAGKYEPQILFDGANGVGALKMQELSKQLQSLLSVELYNTGDGKLNDKCGADFVKVQQCAPDGMPLRPGARCVSVDGDADRIVYYYTDSAGTFHLLDGDRIATLLASYLMELVQASNLKLSLGLVQTAYANGNSTAYISDTLKVPVACVPTGVKHLHHKALEFDIGVYFEANGHGTFVVKDSAIEAILKASQDQIREEAARAAAGRLAGLAQLVNQAVGDALADLLLVEVVLAARGWSAADWGASYTDLPCRQLKVLVQDRRVIETTDAERRCVSPHGLQSTINSLVTRFPSGRAFVRPSGTEDIVRVYAEANTQTNADQLATQVAQAVHSAAGGVGEPPRMPVA